MVATPFSDGGRVVDHDSVARLAAALVARGCTDLIALGVIAEPAALTPAERAAVLETIRAAVPGIGLVAATMDPASEDVAALARRLGERDAIMVPVTGADPARFRRMLVDVHRATGRDVIVQDYPDPTGVHIDVDDLLRALDGLPFVRAVKCEARPTFWRIRRLSGRTRAQLVAGLGGVGLLDDLRAGATAVACGITRPELLRAAMTAWAAGDEAAAEDAVRRLAPLASFETQPLTSIGIRKEHWRRQGVIRSAAVRPPTFPYPADLAAHSAAHGMPERTV